MCQKVHDLDACYNYKKMGVGDRRKFLVKQKVFFGCYEPISKDYSRRNHTRGRICCVCKENHSTGLHGYKPNCIESVPRGRQAMKKNQLIVEEKLHVHQQPSRKMLSVCVWYQLRKNIKIPILFIAPLQCWIIAAKDVLPKQAS